MSKGLRSTTFMVAAVAAIVLAVLLAGCGSGSDSSTTAAGKQPGRGGSLTVALAGGEVETLDPSTALGGGSITVLSQIMETLYKVNAKGENEPWLVTSAKTSNDGRTWVFNLREGVEFSNGKPMTAEDVVFSIDVARKSANYATLFEPFKTVKATSPTTLEITTTQPLPSMEAILTIWVAAVVPKNFGGVSEKTFAEHPIGTGPFELGKWEHGTAVILERNPRYWNPERPYLDKVTFKSAAEDNSRLAQLRAGDVSLIETPPAAELETLENTPGLSVSAGEPGLVQYVVINARSKKFQDPRLREAINLAIDRDAIIKTAMAGYGKLGASFLVPTLPYHDFGLQPPARNTAKATQLLSEAVADGAEPSFTLTVPAGDARYSLMSQIIQSNLEEVGFKVTLQPLEATALLTNLSEGKFEMALEALGAGILDPSENVALYLSTESFFTGAENETVSKLAEEGASEINHGKRREIYYKLQEEVAKENFLVTLGYEPPFWGRSDEVLGFEANALGQVWYADLGLPESEG